MSGRRRGPGRPDPGGRPGLAPAGNRRGARVKESRKKAIVLRIAPELWAELSRWAAAELRSVNAQIEYLLREAVRVRRRQVADPPADDRAPEPAQELPARVEALRAALEGAGRPDAAQQLEQALRSAPEGRLMLANLRAALAEVARAQPALPEEVAAQVRELLDSLARLARGPQPR